MPRLTYLTGLALVLLAGAFLLTDTLTWQPGVTARNVRRIKAGMTLPEVEAVLGGPAQQAQRTDRCGGDWLRVWAAPGAEARVVFGLDDRAQGAAFRPTRNGPPPPFRRVPASLGW